MELRWIDYSSSQNRKYQDQAREAAIRAAREKAELLAKTLGQTIGKAIKIDEAPSESWEQRRSSGASGLENQYIIGGVPISGSQPEETPSISGAVSYTTKLCVVFELK